jgi:hypothetical protein
VAVLSPVIFIDRHFTLRYLQKANHNIKLDVCLH